MEEPKNFKYGRPKKKAAVDMEDNNESYMVKDNPVTIETEESEFVNCLRNEKVEIRYIMQFKNEISNKEHVFYGGMADTASRAFPTPCLKNGKYVNVLTNSEKKFLEHYMGLEKDTLSVHKRTDNFWSDANPNGIGRITLKKSGNYLDLSDPIDYIKYKVLLAWKDVICPSQQQYDEEPLPTYQYIIVRQSEDLAFTLDKVETKEKCFEEYKKIKADKDKMRFAIEFITGRPQSPNSTEVYLRSTLGELMDKDSAKVLRVLTDVYFNTKILVKLAVENGIMSNRSGIINLIGSSEPLCNNNEDSTFINVVKYLNNPKNQALYQEIEAKLNI